MSIQLIVGLGNIGTEYAPTRHNVGFWLLDELAWQWRAAFREEKKFYGDVARAHVSGSDIFLLKPNTYMNLSGKAVAALAQFYKIAPQNILVVHDELDIPCGKIRFKLGGGNGGHNGLKDIQARLGTADFYRLRLGIGHPGAKHLVVGHVLNQPSADERQKINHCIEQSIKVLPDILAGKLDQAVRLLHSVAA